MAQSANANQNLAGHVVFGGNVQQPPVAAADFVSVVFGCTIGTFCQYYDFFITYFFQDEIELAWFPATFDTYIARLILFGIPYAIRPFAGAYWGHMADRKGRRNVLLKTTFGLGISTALFGCIPKYETIGSLSIICVLILRLLQSIFVSGEYSNATLYIYEQTGRESNYAFAQGLMWMGSTGSILAIIIRLILDMYLDLTDWAFRLPYFFGFIVMFLVYFIRRRLPIDVIQDRVNNPIKYVFWNHIKTFWHTLVLLFFVILFPVIGHTSSFYWLPDYLYDLHDPPDSFAYYGLIISMVISLTIMVYIGHLADLYDQLYRRVRISVIANLAAMLSLPFVMLGIADTSNVVGLTIEQIIFCIIALGVIPSTMAWAVGYIEDRNVRSTIFSFVYNTAEALGSGFLSDILNAAFYSNMEWIWAACLAGLIVGTFAAISAFAMLLGTKYHYKSIDVSYNEISSDEDSERQLMMGRNHNISNESQHANFAPAV